MTRCHTHTVARAPAGGRACQILACLMLAEAMTLSAGGCQDSPGSRYCDGPTQLLYDPPAGTTDAFPDDYFTEEDPTSPTGLRVRMIPGDNVTLPESVASYADTFLDLSTLDGFGTTADIVLRVSGPLNPESLPAGGDGSGRPEASLVLLALDEEPQPRYLDFSIDLIREGGRDDSVTLVIGPLEPLRPQSRYGVALTTRVTDADGRCIAPSPTMQQVLSGDPADPGLARIAGPVGELVAALRQAGTVESAGELTAAVVFTTQSTVDTSVAVAREIRQRAPAYREGGCSLRESYRECEGEFDAWDYRVEGRAVDDASPAAQQRYALPVTSWLPLDPPSEPGLPYPTLVFGHGLNGDRYQARRLARLAAPQGVAIVAIDAVKHGDHPDPLEGAESLRVLEFFGISTTLDPPLDGLKLRDNFRQSTYDRLHLVELLRPGLDVDMDGAPDLGHDHLGYLGVSLGGLMSSEFLALAPEVTMAVIVVPGAEVGSIIQHGELMGFLVEIMRGDATDGEVARFFPLLQTVIDRADPGAYGRHVVLERLPGLAPEDVGLSDGPQVLVQMVLNDEIVPNVSNLAFAQAMGVPLTGEALLPLPGVPHEPSLPVVANLRPGVTAGVFEFDVVPSQDGSGLETATHDNVATSEVGVHQTLHFLQTWLSAGVAELVDPYRELGIKD